MDKTNGYDFIYNQHVIKPALISLLGAWISGGIEWDLPHHHRATSFLPMQYKVEENADGSKTVWIGELELRDRMEWTVGVTLHPGKSYPAGVVPHDEPDAGADLDAELLQRRGARERHLPGDLSAEHAVCDVSRQARLHDVADCDDEVQRRGLYGGRGRELVQEPCDAPAHVCVELPGRLFRRATTMARTPGS